MSFSGGNGPLNVLAEPLGCGGGRGGAAEGANAVNCSDYALVVLPRFAWFRRGQVAVDKSSGSISLTPMGMAPRTIAATRPGDTLELKNSQIAGAPQLVFGLGHGAVGLQETAGSFDFAAPTTAAIGHVIAAARTKEYASYEKYGNLSEVKEAVQAPDVTCRAPSQQLHRASPLCTWALSCA